MKKSVHKYDNAPAVSSNPDMVISVPLDCVPKDSALSFPFYLKVNDQYVFFRHAGESVTKARASSLAEKFADVVYLHKSHWSDFLTYLEKGTLATATASTTNKEISLLKLNTRHLCLAYLKDIEEKHEFFRHEIKRYRSALDKLVMILVHTPENAKELIRRFHDVSIFYANHSVNTAIYSIAIGIKAKLNTEELKKLAAASLFHNVGLLHVPQQLLFRPNSLTSHELNLVRSHPIQGAEILEKLRFPKEISRVALEHHECLNGSGYPLELRGGEISLFARICGVASYYDELQSLTPWKQPKTVAEAQTLLTKASDKYDPAILTHALSLNF